MVFKVFSQQCREHICVNPNHSAQIHVKILFGIWTLELHVLKNGIYYMFFLIKTHKWNFYEEWGVYQTPKLIAYMS